MYTLIIALLSQISLLLLTAPVVIGTIYVTTPLSDTTCIAQQSCPVQWLDDGQAPLLADFGSCFVALYNGNGILVQQIQPVNVAAAHSLTFTPDPTAGPDSNMYYINFTSTEHGFSEFSPFFSLVDMTGSFSSPVPSDTSSLPVPSSVVSASSLSVSVTITVGESVTLSASSLQSAPVPTVSVPAPVTSASQPPSSLVNAPSTAASGMPSLPASISSNPPASSPSSTPPTHMTSSSLFPITTTTSGAGRHSPGHGLGARTLGATAIVIAFACILY